MRVAELWRFPVKSLQGERLDAGQLTPDGIVGDRRYALFDVETGYGLTARRAPELLFAAARLRADGMVEITLPDGSVAADDAALSSWLGRAVELRHCTEVGEVRYEGLIDDHNEASSGWEVFEGSSVAFHDSERIRVSLLSTASMRNWDRRRFRANVVLDGAGEDELVGSRVRLGDAELAVTNRIGRCVMTTRPQPDGIDKDLSVLRTIHRDRGGRLAVGCVVTHPGMVRLGDAIKPVPDRTPGRTPGHEPA